VRGGGTRGGRRFWGDLPVKWRDEAAKLPVPATFVSTWVAGEGRFWGAGRRDAVLRFTHAEAISPFASLLGIPEASMAAAVQAELDGDMIAYLKDLK